MLTLRQHFLVALIKKKVGVGGYVNVKEWEKNNFGPLAYEQPHNKQLCVQSYHCAKEIADQNVICFIAKSRSKKRNSGDSNPAETPFSFH